MMRKYHRTLSVPHYLKGALFTYLIFERLQQNEIDYKDYLKYVYESYYLQNVTENDPTYNNFFSIDSHRMDSYDMLDSLEDFSGISFKDLFDAYVFGEEVMDIDRIENISLGWDY